MKNEPELQRNKRPLAITFICIYDFIILLFGIYIFSLPSVQKFFPSKNILLLINWWMIAHLIVDIGLWRMKKWAAYIYILVKTENLVTGELSPGSLIMKAFIIYFISKNTSKMS